MVEPQGPQQMKPIHLLATLLAVLPGSILPITLTAAATTSNWPQFRGPNGSGIAPDDKPAPVYFGARTNQHWQTEIPRGHSSPCVWGDRIFLTGFDTTNKVAETICVVRANGMVLWRKSAPKFELEKSMHEFNSPAAPTPAADGERVVVYFPPYGVLAYDHAGKEVWNRPLPLPPTDYGNGSSPIIHGGLVLVQRDGNSTNSHVLALDAKTGKTRWTVERPLNGESYSTPMVWTHDGVSELITVGNGRLDAYDVKNGKARWWTPGLTFLPIGTAVAGDGLLFASSAGAAGESEPPYVGKWEDVLAQFDKDKDGQLAKEEVPEDVTFKWRKNVPDDILGNNLPWRWLLFTLFHPAKADVFTREDWKQVAEFIVKNPNNLMAIKPGGNENISRTHLAWKGTRGIPDMPSPLYYRGRVYLMMDCGMLTSYDAKSGKLVMDRERIGVTSQFVSSPVAAGGNIYVASLPGKIAVIKAADKLEVVAVNDLKENITATPAVLEGKIYVRTANHLAAFGN